MAANKGDYLTDKVLSWLKGITFPSAPTVYCALMTTAPSTDGTGGVEVTTTSSAYARQAVTFGAIAGATGNHHISNSGTITFPTATASWGTIVAACLYDSATPGAGNLLYVATLASSKTVGNGDTFTFAVSQFDTKEQ